MGQEVEMGQKAVPVVLAQGLSAQRIEASMGSRSVPRGPMNVLVSPTGCH